MTACFTLGFFPVEARAETSGLRITKEAAPAVTLLPADNEELADIAGVLKETLKEITGTELPAGDGAWAGHGILLALTKSLPGSEKGLADKLKEKPVEAYGYDITVDQAVIAGNSPKALRDGVYALLEQLGCRWLVPSKRWTIIPKTAEVVLSAQQMLSVPDFSHRYIRYAYGIGNMGEEIAPALKHAYEIWCDANRLDGVGVYKVGHAYASTVLRHQAEFQTHPEYFAMKEDGSRFAFEQTPGRRGFSQSLCYSNPEVARFFIEDKLAELQADKQENPHNRVVSMDPNDGSQACFCGECRKLGNGSDQALHLANQVARALRERFPDAIVTMYAYASHRLPPENVKVEPNVEVQVAMGFNKTQYTLEQLVALWMEKVSAVGIRDYFGVMAWDWGLPGRGKASNYQYVSTYLPKYHQWGARTFKAEINANWASFGPATYVATKLLWDSETDPDRIYDDYFDKGFGSAASEVKALYAMFSGNGNLSRQNLHRWLSQLEKAFQAAEGENEGVQQRLTDLAAFLHYAVLYRQWELALDSGDQDKAYEALRPLLEFTWRIRDRNMVHAYALQRRLVNSGHEKIRPLREGWRFNEPGAVWRHPELLADAEILALFEQDVRDHPEDKRIVDFGGKLAPGNFPPKEEETKGGLRYKTVWHVLVKHPEHLAFQLPMRGVKANYRLEIFDESGEWVWESEASVDETSKRYEQKLFEMEVKFPAPGQYTLVFNAGEDYVPQFPPGLLVALDVSPERFPFIRMWGPGYFYVPKGTENILAVVDGRFSVIQPDTATRSDYSGSDNDPAMECVVIPVDGKDGQIWTMEASTSGRVALLNIPPYVATNPGRLLVPKEGNP